MDKTITGYMDKIVFFKIKMVLHRGLYFFLFFHASQSSRTSIFAVTISINIDVCAITQRLLRSLSLEQRVETSSRRCAVVRLIGILTTIVFVVHLTFQRRRQDLNLRNISEVRH